MDGVDEDILRELRVNAKIKLKVLGKKLSIPLSTVHSRIKKMENTRTIKRYTINTNWKKLGYGIKAYVLVYFDTTKLEELKKSQWDMLSEIRKLDFVHDADAITGDGDFLIKVRAKDPKHLGQLLSDYIHSIPGIVNTKTFVAIS
jgi:DNA-binding Lrp family transcriptional regulator